MFTVARCCPYSHGLMERGLVDMLLSLVSALSLASRSELPLPPWAFEVDCPAAAGEIIVFEEPNTQLTIDSSAVGRGTLKLTEHHLCWTSAEGANFAFHLRNLVAMASSESSVHCIMYARCDLGDRRRFTATLSPSKVESGISLYSAIDRAMLREISMPGKGEGSLRMRELLSYTAPISRSCVFDRKCSLHAIDEGRCDQAYLPWEQCISSC